MMTTISVAGRGLYSQPRSGAPKFFSPWEGVAGVSSAPAAPPVTYNRLLNDENT